MLEIDNEVRKKKMVVVFVAVAVLIVLLGMTPGRRDVWQMVMNLT